MGGGGGGGGGVLTAEPPAEAEPGCDLTGTTPPLSVICFSKDVCSACTPTHSGLKVVASAWSRNV